MGMDEVSTINKGDGRIRKAARSENGNSPVPATLDLETQHPSCREGAGLSPWLSLPVDDYDMGVVKAQWWADKKYGEKWAR